MVNLAGLLFLCVLACPWAVWGISRKAPLFRGDLCQVQCETRPHTMCPTLEIPASSYRKFRHGNVAYYRNMDAKALLLHGHNGIRNRIAERMGVANMAELTWDRELEQMAERYMRFGEPYSVDECTRYSDAMSFQTFIAYYISGEMGHRFIGQNHFCSREHYFPIYFIQRACAAWYRDSKRTEEPRHEINVRTYRIVGVLKGHNNYTHLAFPYINRMGCSLASYEDDNVYCVTCNYYPFFSTENAEVIFDYGHPASMCPVLFPMKAEHFQGICSAGGLRELPKLHGIK